MGNSRGMRSRSRGYTLPLGNERCVSGLQLELENVVSGGTGQPGRRVRVLRVSAESRLMLVGCKKDTPRQGLGVSGRFRSRVPVATYADTRR